MRDKRQIKNYARLLPMAARQQGVGAQWVTRSIAVRAIDAGLVIEIGDRLFATAAGLFRAEELTSRAKPKPPRRVDRSFASVSQVSRFLVERIADAGHLMLDAEDLRLARDLEARGLIRRTPWNCPKTGRVEARNRFVVSAKGRRALAYWKKRPPVVR